MGKSLKMTTYKAYLEVRDDSRAMGHVLALPGCFTKASSQEEVIARLPAAIREYWSWLSRHGEKVPSPTGDLVIEIAEVVPSDAGFVSGDKVALFGPDREAPREKELEIYLRRMEYSRQDLLELVRRIPERLMDEGPGGGRRTIRQTLQHIARAEWWYLSRIYQEPDMDEMPEDISEALGWIREEAVARLRAFPLADRSRVFIRDEFISPWGAGESWIFRKVLRRFIEHEREHTKSIAALSQELSKRKHHTNGRSR